MNCGCKTTGHDPGCPQRVGWNNQFPAITNPITPCHHDASSHDDAACDAAWDAHCGRHLKKERELLLQNRQLRDALRARRAMEPKHSREDHECEECVMLAEIVAGEVLAEVATKEKRKCPVQSPSGKVCLLDVGHTTHHESENTSWPNDPDHNKRNDQDGHVHVYKDYQCERCGKGQPINQQCWCAVKAEAKDAKCPVHD